MTPQPCERVLIAPDAFKGSLSCVDVAAAMARGFQQASPETELVMMPMTDGGEGAIAAISTAIEGQLMPMTVSGPYGASVEASWWLSNGLAVIEMAQASGLSLSVRREPLVASSFGTGQLLEAALAADVSEVWLCCGGSATVDGGAGLLEALGFQLLDRFGRPIGTGGGALLELATIRPPQLEFNAQIKVLCDVVNPLTGPDGAAWVYGPQKGADPDAIIQLDAGLVHFAKVLDDTFGRDPIALVGGGAAGGLPAALWTALGAELCGGFETIAERFALARAVAHADLVITGEGRIDDQTPYGKTIGGLIGVAREHKVPVWAIGGQVTQAAQDWCPSDVELFTLMEAGMSEQFAMRQAAELIEARVRRLVLGPER